MFSSIFRLFALLLIIVFYLQLNYCSTSSINKCNIFKSLDWYKIAKTLDIKHDLKCINVSDITKAEEINATAVAITTILTTTTTTTSAPETTTTKSTIANSMMSTTILPITNITVSLIPENLIRFQNDDDDDDHHHHVFVEEKKAINNENTNFKENRNNLGPNYNNHQNNYNQNNNNPNNNYNGNVQDKNERKNLNNVTKINKSDHELNNAKKNDYNNRNYFNDSFNSDKNFLKISHFNESDKRNQISFNHNNDKSENLSIPYPPTIIGYKQKYDNRNTNNYYTGNDHHVKDNIEKDGSRIELPNFYNKFLPEFKSNKNQNINNNNEHRKENENDRNFANKMKELFGGSRYLGQRDKLYQKYKVTIKDQKDHNKSNNKKVNGLKSFQDEKFNQTNDENVNHDLIESPIVVDRKSLVVKNINEFGFHIFKKIVRYAPNDNIFFSPFSIYTLLMCLLSGSGGQSYNDLNMLLNKHYLTNNDLENNFMKIKDKLLNEHKAIKLLTILLLSENFHLKNEYERKINEIYKSEIQVVNFIKNGREIKDYINDLVEKSTAGKINELLNKPPNVNTKLLVLNTILFKENWLNKFKPSLTHKHKFKNLDGSTSKVDMMENKEHPIDYNCEINDYKLCTVLLPYESKKLSMVIFMPIESKNLDDVSNKLSSDFIKDKLSKLKNKIIEFGLPKFQIKQTYNIETLLTIVGVKSIFDGHSNFTRISSGTNLYVKSIKHQSFIEVDEQGTVAASATYASFEDRLAPTKFYIDKPFIFAIIDNNSNLVLFTGRINHL